MDKVTTKIIKWIQSDRSPCEINKNTSDPLRRNRAKQKKRQQPRYNRQHIYTTLRYLTVKKNRWFSAPTAKAVLTLRTGPGRRYGF